MRAGKLRHWLTFERPGESEQDSDGALVETWVDAFEISFRMPCQVETLSGRELLAAQAIASKTTHRISTRYRPGFDGTMRATNQATGAIYNIEAVLPDNESGRREVRLLASSGLNAGGTAA